jgi:hypothetical protein
MTLSAVTKGKRAAPDRVLMTGTEGIGKTKFGADAPSPIFIAAEDGIRQFDVASFPEPESFDDVLAAIDELIAGDHAFRTLVIDTLDWIEPLVFAKVCARNGWKTIEDPGYGKGYAVAADEWRGLLAKLDELRLKRGMEIILVAHTNIKTFQNPLGPDYSRYEIALNKSAAALVKQWTDVNLFATYEEVYTDPKKGKVKGVSTGARVLHTERTAAWDAKNRYDLPPILPLSYEEYAAARSAGLQATAADVYAECVSLLSQVPENAKASEYVEANKDNAPNLLKALNKLRVQVSDAGKA